MSRFVEDFFDRLALDRITLEDGNTHWEDSQQIDSQVILFGRRVTAYEMNLNMEVTSRVAVGTHVPPRRTERLRLPPTRRAELVRKGSTGNATSDDLLTRRAALTG
jgi:hypothetical protein